MDAVITPARLAGTVTPPASKSAAHRLLIAAALAEGKSRLDSMAYSADVNATIDCLSRLGAAFQKADGALWVEGIGASAGCLAGRRLTLDCGESGSTLRFLIPIALALANGGRFLGHGRLPQRPQEPYAALFREKGVAFSQDETGLTAAGRLQSGEFALAGNVSSQFFTGLLFALPLLVGDSVLRSTTQLESASYLELTREALRLAGIDVRQTGEGTFHIPGNSRYRPFCAAVEPDWSQAAFFCAMQFGGCPIRIEAMRSDSAQGDRAILGMIERMKAPGALTIDLSDCPDLLPPAAAAAAFRKKGEVTRFDHASRLRLKESDRLATVSAALGALGVPVMEEADALTVTGVETPAGGCEIDAANDHRIAMMAAAAAVRCRSSVVIRGAECVKKSYPDFWEVYASLGGAVTLR